MENALSPDQSGLQQVNTPSPALSPQIPVNQPQSAPVVLQLTQPEGIPVPQQSANPLLPPVETEAPSQTAAISPTFPSQSTQTASHDNQSVSKKKKAAYFAVGFIFHFLALIPITLWLIFVVKKSKKPRVISYFAGIIAAIIFWTMAQYFLLPLFQPAMVNKFPELTYIPEGLTQEYPGAQFSVGMEYRKELSGENSRQAVSTITVNLITDQQLTPDDFTAMGKKTCRLLEENGNNYDEVKIQKIEKKGFLIFSFDSISGISGTCEEWK